MTVQIAVNYTATAKANKAAVEATGLTATVKDGIRTVIGDAAQIAAFGAFPGIAPAGTMAIHFAGFELGAVKNIARRWINFEDSILAMVPAAFQTPGILADIQSREGGLAKFWRSLDGKDAEGLVGLFAASPHLNLASLLTDGTISVNHLPSTFDAAFLDGAVLFFSEFFRVAAQQQRLFHRGEAVERFSTRLDRMVRDMAKPAVTFARDWAAWVEPQPQAVAA